MSHSRLPLVVRAAVRAFAFCMRVLPRRHYNDFAVEMRADFQQIALSSRARWGAFGVLFVLVRSVFDVLIRAAADRWSSADDLQPASLPWGERMQLFGHELRMAARTIAKRPGFTFVAVLTLALGIGANVAIFAVVNAVLIRPLPYFESERLVRITHHAPGLNLPDLENSAATLALYEKFARSFSGIAAYTSTERNLTGGTEPARIGALRATPSLFDVLRVQPALGRRLVEADGRKGAPAVAVLTHSGWVAHFGGARDVIGRVIQLTGVATEIVGVMPKDFAFPDGDTDVIIPEQEDAVSRFGSFGARGIARLAPGVSLAAAQAEVTQLQLRLNEIDPEVKPEFLQKAGWSATVRTLRDSMVRDAETGLWIVLGTVGFLLLVACASVANLFLVRSESRQREVGIRFALGATRGRVAGVFLSESVLLGLAGGAWGVLLAFFGVRALIAAGPAQLPRLNEVNLDATVLLFATAVSLLAGIVFGVLPLPHQMRRPLHGIVRSGRGHTTGRDRQRVRKTLIVAQIALALILVTGSGLMLRSFQRLRAVNAGIIADGVLTLGVSVGEERSKAQAAAVYQHIIDEVAAIPGVRKVSATNAIPLIPDGLNGGSFNIRSKPRAEGALPPVSMYASVAEHYFQAIGAPLLKGRAIERADHELKRSVAVVSEGFERAFLDGDAIGKEIFFGNDSTWMEIVGVVGDVRIFGLRDEILPMAYLPMTTTLSSTEIGLMYLVVRTTGDPGALAPAVRAAVKRIEPTTPLMTARTMNDVLNASMAETSFTTVILIVAALVALLLGAIGLYGVINYVVSQRTQEIGVRIALGAIPGQVRALVLRQGLTLAAIGIVIGLAGAVTLTRLLGSLLYEVKSRDPITFALVALVMLGVSSFAAYVPARRASAVSPLQALRSD